MNVLPALAVAVFSSFAALILKKNNPEIAMLVTVSGVVISALIALESVAGFLSEATAVFSADEKYLSIPIKALGVSLMTTVVSKLCEDAGEKAMSFTVSIAGKTAVLLTALPLFAELSNLLMRILKLE